MHIDKLYELYVSPNYTKVIKSKSVRWAGHLACVVEGRCMDSYTWKYENIKQRGILEDLGVNGRIMLKWILMK